ncbi:MAG: zinc metallopeptidase [Lachnospiraceae bacterium]|nr:zinc metallopeptidase [Lachnospiraceae bacterium]
MPYYGYYFNGYYSLDPSYLLVLIGGVICIIASVWVNAAMKKYNGIQNARGITGAEAAERILMDAGIYDVRVECLPKGGGDHYDPRSKTVRLSYENYNYTTVTAVAVAAHECGHACQHHENYMPLSLRTSMVPVVNLASKWAIPLIVIGVIVLNSNPIFIQVGIWAFLLAVLFQLVTLPVEFNASRRAMAVLERNGLLGMQEQQGARKVLTAAAMTYVAAAAYSVFELLRLILQFGGGSRKRD